MVTIVHHSEEVSRLRRKYNFKRKAHAQFPLSVRVTRTESAKVKRTAMLGVRRKVVQDKGTRKENCRFKLISANEADKLRFHVFLTVHSSRRTSLVKPPNHATTSCVD